MLEFVLHNLEEPEDDVEECQQRGLTLASGLRVALRLVVWDIDEDSGTRSIRDMKEQDVYLGEMPLMTPNGTFVVNGVEKLLFHKCTDHQEFSLIMIKEKPMHLALFCLQLELFL